MFLIAGPPGAGKTTQAKKIAAVHGLERISVGQLLRDMAGPEEKALMDAGDLVPDSFVERILSEEIDMYDDRTKVLIDGFPRNFAEARWLVEDFAANISAYILLEVTDEVVQQRLQARGRADDTPEGIAERLEIFHEQTLSIVQYFEEQLIPVVNIDGSLGIDEVQDLLVTKLGLE